MKPLIVGEAPSKNQDPERPVEGRIGKRLANCAGLPYDDFLQHFERVNLLHERQEVNGKGFVFDLHKAHGTAIVICTKLEPGRVVLLLGHRVAKAFGIKTAYFKPQRLQDLFEMTAFVVPHPSSINRWWNSRANVTKAIKFMHDIVEQTRV